MMPNRRFRRAVLAQSAVAVLLTILVSSCSDNNEIPVSGGAASSPPVSTYTYTVNSTEDLVDSLPGDGKCESSAGTCTLRAAIMETNRLPVAVTIPTVYVPAGHYRITIPPVVLTAGVTDSSSGAFAPNASVRVQGASARQTIIDGNQLDSVFVAWNPLVSLALSDLTLTGGVAHEFDNHPNGGGGVFSMGRLELTRVTVSGNHADYGGGVESTLTGSAVIDSSTISNNTANIEAGGIRFDAAAVLINSTVSGNTVLSSCCEGGMNYPGGSYGEGGGVDARGVGVVRIVNSTIVNNHAVIGGGGVNIATTYTGDQGGLLETLNLHPGGPMEITNSIIAGNSSDRGPRSCGNTIAQILSHGGNIVDDDSCPHDGPGDLAHTDPQLRPLTDNGGPTDTLAPQNGSQAIGNGVIAACPDTDQRGVSRPKGQHCDSGAVQSSRRRD